MYNKNLAIYSIYSILLGLYAISIRLFFFGLEITNVIAKQQAFNVSGLILILAVAVTFNLIIIKGVLNLKNAEPVTN